MRRTLTTALALAALLFAAGADAQTPTRGGTITVALNAEPPHLDPTASTSQEIARMLYGNVLEGLVRFDDEGRILPLLAERWSVSRDGLVWTFTLKPGVRFHDGQPLTAAAVKAKFDRARTAGSGHTNHAYYKDITEITTPDDRTVTFRLATVNADFLFDLARPDSVIHAPGDVEAQKTRPVGTGPFRFVAWDRGSAVRLARFDGYHEPGLPYLDGAVFRFLPDPSAQMAALEAGDLDVIGYALSPENALKVKGNPALRLIEGRTTTEITVGLNNSRRPFSDVRVRRAIAHATNRKEIVDGAMFGFGTPIGSHMSPGERYYVDTSGTYPYDPERAKALLAEAGYPNGFEATFSLPAPYPYERRAGELLAAQLAKVGIRLRLEVVEWTTWLTRIFRNADYDMTIIGHSEPFDIGIYANPGYYFRYDNPEFRALLEKGRKTLDEGERAKIYADLQRMLARDAVNDWLYSSPYLAATRATVQGWWRHQPTPSMNLVRVWLAR
ncbi:MAG TPA: ABC transporter substrate-binding protein [Thermodesulfobacteriota bacterium]